MSSKQKQNNLHVVQEPNRSEENFRPKPFNVSGKQIEYKRLIYLNTYTLATGFAGTGKTYVPTRLAAQMYKDGEIKKIAIVRPAESDSKSLGFSKGTDIEKMMEWIAPVMDTLKEDFLRSKIRTMLEYEELLCVPLEKIKGRSFKDTFIIIDEAEDITVKELKKVLTRAGENCKMVLCGDLSQIDLKPNQKSGLAQAVQILRESEDFRSVVGHVHFSEYGDILRGDDMAKVLRVLDEYDI